MERRWKFIMEAPNYKVSDDGLVVNNRTNRQLKPHLQNGYEKVTLSVCGKAKSRSVHRLVAKAFCEGYNPSLNVNHIDGDKRNNHFTNLVWVTQQENVNHAFRTGLSVSGRRRPVRVIETGEVFESQSECAEAIGGQQSMISAVLSGKTKHHRGLTFEFV